MGQKLIRAVIFFAFDGKITPRHTHQEHLAVLFERPNGSAAVRSYFLEFHPDAELFVGNSLLQAAQVAIPWWNRFIVP